MDKRKFASIAGWIGMILILGAYFLISYNFVKGESFLYQIINLIGASGLFYNAYFSKSKPLMTLQLSWAIIAIIAIIKIYI
jgi:hypothetical protein